ncbi:MAG: hypothetical protein ACREWJ_01350 [Rhodoferax sp.]
MFNRINRTVDRDAAIDVAGVHRNAYNAAFSELGLRWYWDSEIYPEVLSEADERRCLRQYMVTHQPHLLTAYDADFLVDAIQAVKAKCYDRMKLAGCKGGTHVNRAALQHGEVGF